MRCSISSTPPDITDRNPTKKILEPEPEDVYSIFRRFLFVYFVSAPLPNLCLKD
jgi:hypothetical protein